MYQIGDYIMYGNMGVCRIEKIEKQRISDSMDEQLCYVLATLHQQCTITIPVNNTKVFMRSVISGDEAERLIDMIPSIQAEPWYYEKSNELVEHYSAVIKTFNCADLIELTMSIYAKTKDLQGKKKKLGAVDERFMRQAEELLFGELAVALGLPRDEVPNHIASRVEAMRRAGGEKQ